MFHRHCCPMFCDHKIQSHGLRSTELEVWIKCLFSPELKSILFIPSHNFTYFAKNIIVEQGFTSFWFLFIYTNVQYRRFCWFRSTFNFIFINKITFCKLVDALRRNIIRWISVTIATKPFDFSSQCMGRKANWNSMFIPVIRGL